MKVSIDAVANKYMLRSRRAQLQMGEIVIVMVIFFMLLAFGILFYTQFAKGQLRQTQAEIEQADVSEMGKLISGIPEIHCSIGGRTGFSGDEDLACIDLYRVQFFQAEAASTLHYHELFNGFKADLACLYPQPCSDIGISDYTLFDYTDPQGESSDASFKVPVYIKNPNNGKQGYGLITITHVT